MERKENRKNKCKKNKEKIKKQHKGITLIALVITVVILLILAGISLNLVLGENGIIKRSEDAASQTNDASLKEQVELAIASSTMEGDYQYNKDNAKTEIEKIEGVTVVDNGDGTLTVTKDGITVNVDKYGNTTVVGQTGNGGAGDETNITNPEEATPSTATVIEADANQGIVISVNGNEYVWIEVPKTIYTNSTYANTTSNPSHSGGNADGTVTSKEDTEGIKNVLNEYTKDYKDTSCIDEWYAVEDTWCYSITAESVSIENGCTTGEEKKALTNGCGLNYSDYYSLYNNMLKSVYTYGGFWIGRYEAGDEESTARTEESAGVSNPAVSKANVIPYNWVTCQQAQTLASSMAPNGYTSSLMFGVQWDLVLKYLETKATWDTTTNTARYYLSTDSTNWGNYPYNLWNITGSLAKYSTNSGADWSATPYGKTNSIYILLTTGASQSFSKMNIFDLAGNVTEWTLEHSTLEWYVPYTSRGGYFYYAGGQKQSASYRERWRYEGLEGGHSSIGFRAALFCNTES